MLITLILAITVALVCGLALLYLKISLSIGPSCEELLVSAHYYETARWIRRRKMRKAHPELRRHQQDWINDVINLSAKKWEVVQRELYIRAAQKNSSDVICRRYGHVSFDAKELSPSEKEVYDSDYGLLRSYERQLKELNRKRWAIQKRIFRMFTDMKPEGSWIREFEADQAEFEYWEKQNKQPVAMHPELVELCKLIGGFCARECGCCTRPRNMGIGKDTYAHCSQNCQCCIVDRGYHRTLILV